MNTIAILSGGTSDEREVSLRSGKAVATALQSKGYKTVLIDPRDGLGGAEQADAVFIALHGEGGEDGTVQAELEKRGLPYVGADVESSELCFDKHSYKHLLRQHQLPLADGEVVSESTIWKSPLIIKPFVLKPINGGSSIDTYIVRDPAQLPKAAIQKSLTEYGTMLLEELIEGIEITAAVLGDRALPIVEIIPPANGEFDYNNKYNGATQELCPPEHLSEDIQSKINALALRIHRLTGVRDLSRTDMIVTPKGRLVILETNTLPGMTDQSLYPKAALAAGIAFADLVDELIRMALERAKTTTV